VLTALIVVPIVGAILVYLMPRANRHNTRIIALAAALVDLLLAVVLAAGFQPAAELQYQERGDWVPALGIQYYLGVDGISLWLVVLTAFLTPIAIGASWPWMEERAKEYGALLLLLEAGVIGALAAADVVLFFVFWEVMLIPMYLLIGVCGGERRVYAAFKFFIYTAVGSLLMLVGIIMLYANSVGVAGRGTFVLADLVRTPLPPGAQAIVFLFFALAFAIKVPIFPLHTWLPDAYTQAPITTLVLGTMLVKVGAYGFIRFCLPLFPTTMQANSWWITLLAVVGIIYAALCAIAQRDLVRMLAYSSVSHMGFIVLGIFALNTQGIMGGIFQMVSHGLAAGMLFIIAAMLLRRTGSLDIPSLGGLASRYPIITAYFLLAMFASAGVPGLSGFVGELLTMLGAYQPHRSYVVVAACGVVLGAIYLFWMFQRVMHGRPQTELTTQPHDLTRREAWVLTPLAIASVVLGLQPDLLLTRMEPSVNASLSTARLVQTVPVDALQTASLVGVTLP
jgi:NADH-quinone oxidoreductase subunit M